MSITDKSAEADFFVAFSRQYKLSNPKTCICQKPLDDTPLYIKHVREAYTIFRGERFLFIMCYTGKME